MISAQIEKLFEFRDTFNKTVSTQASSTFQLFIIHLTDKVSFFTVLVYIRPWGLSCFWGFCTYFSWSHNETSNLFSLGFCMVFRMICGYILGFCYGLYSILPHNPCEPYVSFSHISLQISFTMRRSLDGWLCMYRHYGNFYLFPFFLSLPYHGSGENCAQCLSPTSYFSATNKTFGPLKWAVFSTETVSAFTSSWPKVYYYPYIPPSTLLVFHFLLFTPPGHWDLILLGLITLFWELRWVYWFYKLSETGLWQCYDVSRVINNPLGNHNTLANRHAIFQCDSSDVNWLTPLMYDALRILTSSSCPWPGLWHISVIIWDR